MEFPEEFTDRLRRLDLHTLYDFAGSTVVSAVKSVFETDQEIALARIVGYKYGYAILNDRNVRNAVIEGLNRDEIEKLCYICGISANSRIELYVKAIRYFKSYTPEKSQKLIDYLRLPPAFYLHPKYDERESVETINVRHGQEVIAKSYLHPYQKLVKDEICKQLYKAPSSRFIVQMPTGAGKTYTALEAVVDSLRAPNQKGFVVWLVDSNELCEQALTAFRDLWILKGDSPLEIFRLFSHFESDFQDYESGVVFAGFAKFYSVICNPKHTYYNSVFNLIRKTHLVVVDEAHGAVAETRQAVVDAFGGNSPASIIGLTATPARVDDAETEELSKLFHGSLISLVDSDGKTLEDPLQFLQDGGYLAEVDGQVLDTGTKITESKESRIHVALARNEKRNEVILEQMMLAHKSQDPTLVFACTKDHVLALRVLCESKNIPVEHITGDVTQADRIQILNAFRRNEFFILINLDILATGIDVPNVKKLILTRPIGSPIQYSQIMGRALRGPKNGGNQKNIVVNVRDNLTNFPQANMLYEAFSDQFMK